METCAKVGCTEKAICVIKLMVPAKGFKLDEHQPLSALMNLCLCKPHANKIDAKQFIKDSPGLLLAFEAMARGRAAPDFDRAFVQTVSLDSEEYRQYKSMR